jgi:hypothetical protein
MEVFQPVFEGARSQNDAFRQNQNRMFRTKVGNGSVKVAHDECSSSMNRHTFRALYAELKVFRECLDTNR